MITVIFFNFNDSMTLKLGFPPCWGGRRQESSCEQKQCLMPSTAFTAQKWMFPCPTQSERGKLHRASFPIRDPAYFPCPDRALGCKGKQQLQLQQQNPPLYHASDFGHASQIQNESKPSTQCIQSNWNTLFQLCPFLGKQSGVYKPRVVFPRCYCSLAWCGWLFVPMPFPGCHP